MSEETGKVAEETPHNLAPTTDGESAGLGVFDAPSSNGTHDRAVIDPRTTSTPNGDGDGDGDHDPASPVIDKPTPPSPPRMDVVSEEHSPPPPPPPPPKSDTKPTPPTRVIPIPAESQASLQKGSSSRYATPAGSRRENGGGQSTRTASPGLPSVSSPVQSPSRPASRPGSARPSPSHHHSRRSSTATTLSLTAGMSVGTTPGHSLSSVLITPPLQVLVSSKEARKSASFLAASQKALNLCHGDGSNAAYLHPREIFEPLRLAISNPQTTSVPILITSLDLLSKLISHSFFSEPNGSPKGLSPLPDLITHTITLSYSEASPPQVALQVVKALMAIVLSTDQGMLVHQSSLLKAIRTVYNVFLLSNDAGNQVVAQGGLTQMVHHVFGRVIRPSSAARRSTVGENEARRLDESREATPAPETPKPENGEKLTL